MNHESEQYISMMRHVDMGSTVPAADVAKTVDLLEKLPGIEAPQNKQQKKALSEVIRNATPASPVTIYVGSCPDYSHENGLYTHQGIGENVPLLSEVHINSDLSLLRTLESNQIPYEYVLMVADVEAIDEVFSQKFTGGDQEEFLRRCLTSAQATQNLLDSTKQKEGLIGGLRSSSFFTEFGYENFLQIQNAYMATLSERYDSDSSFRQRVTGDIAARMGMYKKMYDKVLPSLGFRDTQDFLVYRDIRTKAQYLALGRAISEKSKNAIIVNHPTTNLGFFNDRNKYPLPTDNGTPQRTIPLFKMTKSVY